MDQAVIDLNADVGEGFGRWILGDDDALLGVISSANIACGFHAGDPSIMRSTCAVAAERGVAIGAQVSYPDLVGFGRRRMAIERSALADDVLYQIGALEASARAAGSRVSYVKPHGALNNACDTDAEQASAIVDAIVAWDASLLLYVIPGTQLEQQAVGRGLVTISEAYPDRGYRSDGRLVPRSEPGAVLDDEAVVVDRAIDLAARGTVRSATGESLSLAPRSICLHGDNQASLRAARDIKSALIGAGITVAAP